ncbi:hypothetical protein J3A83DRAFT_4184695 [Scleroderma citrinum]
MLHSNRLLNSWVEGALATFSLTHSHLQLLQTTLQFLWTSNHHPQAVTQPTSLSYAAMAVSSKLKSASGHIAVSGDPQKQLSKGTTATRDAKSKVKVEPNAVAKKALPLVLLDTVMMMSRPFLASWSCICLFVRDGWKTITALHKKSKYDTAINRKAVVSPLDDPELADVSSDENEPKANVIEISEKDGEGKDSMAPIKNALSAISTRFNPDVMQWCDASWMAHQLQMIQSSTYQTEIHELHSQMYILQDWLAEETHHADKVESKVQMFQMMWATQLVEEAQGIIMPPLLTISHLHPLPVI